ncbi:Ribosomal RNA small subunit methyltransferase I [bioreactor metagenome]|uniref:Ribosomal RNA small subunit methyltransferase I n=1 Tax=bioreactor metagenome TaxID=1076179 RepID=A0A644V867_9ZZZZ|nr:16S rRNA (cytidine(1402)-2'-O)-methyltransferase [Candidatus Elulimicrobiales bacterium]
MKSTFYIVGTPIGNLEDMSFRAVKTLKEVDLILCEDVSNTQKILKHFEIETKCTNYFANSRLSKIDEIINLLEESKNLALVSDAGMPTISDPGSLLIQKIYEAKDKGLEVEIKVIPGPTALASALALSGFTGGEFIFYGFLPHKKGRETIFKEISESKKISVFYESVHRIEKCLESLEKFLEENRKIIVARELTKIYEEVVRGSAEEVKNYFKENKEKIRGEFVVVVDSV